MNYSIVTSYFSDLFDLEEVTTSVDDQSIDGVAAIIADDLACTSDDAKVILDKIRPRQQAIVSYIFTQAKRSEGLETGEILKFGLGVQRLFEETQDSPTDEVLLNFLGLHEVVVDNLSKIQNGRPDCNLYFAYTGTWQDDSNVIDAIKVIESNIISTGYFNSVKFHIVDRERLMRYWLQSQTPVQDRVP